MISLTLPSSFLIATAISTIVIVWIFHKYFLKPYMLLQKYKKYKGGLFIYRPIIGTMRETKDSGVRHGDAAYDIKKRVTDDPKIRFVASTFVDRVQLIFYDPELVKQLLNKDTVTTTKYPGIIGDMSEFMKNGLVFTEGEKWKRQRKLISQVFHFDYMNNSLPIIRATAKEWINKNCKSSTSSSPCVVNVSKELKMFTSAVIWRIFFGEDRFDTSQNAPATVKLILGNLKTSRDLSISIWNFIFGHQFFKLGLRPIDRKYLQETKAIKSLLYSKLEQLRKNINQKSQPQPETTADEPAKFKNLIELLVGQSEGLPDLEIVSQIFTFFIAGTDTTSELLSISNYLLATYPQVQAKLREEVLSHVGKTEDIKYEHIPKMEYLHAVIKEALRFGGPVLSVGFRIATQDFMLEEIEIKKGTLLAGSLAGVAYNSKYFSNPEQFRPERWIEKVDPATINTSIHLPFSAGARKCIGEQLALIESKIMLCELVRQFNIELQTPYELKMRISLLYHAEPDVSVVFTPIN